MELFGAYLRQRVKSILMISGCAIIYFVCFAMYHLPLRATIYPTILCVVLSMIYLILDFKKVKQKIEVLRYMENVPEVLEEHLPSSESVLETAYQSVLRELWQKQKELQMAMNRNYQDMIDYYTVWAHQIKTPIASMRLHLQNEDSMLSRQLSGDLFRIEQYVEMVLMFLRLDSDSSDYVFREYDLDEIVRAAVKKFSGEFISRKIGLSYEKIEEKVLTDEKWLSFVVEQVLSNALKYTMTGTVSIYMEEEQILCIRDTGIGIAPEDLPRIFEKGYTGYNGRMDKKASGIGLYLCRRICDNLGHRIWAQSEPDKGTTIRIDVSHRKMKFE